MSDKLIEAAREAVAVLRQGVADCCGDGDEELCDRCSAALSAADALRAARYRSLEAAAAPAASVDVRCGMCGGGGKVNTAGGKVRCPACGGRGSWMRPASSAPPDADLLAECRAKVEVARAVASGQIPREAGALIIKTTFPTVSMDEADRMMGDAGIWMTSDDASLAVCRARVAMVEWKPGADQSRRLAVVPAPPFGVIYLAAGESGRWDARLGPVTLRGMAVDRAAAIAAASECGARALWTLEAGK